MNISNYSKAAGQWWGRACRWLRSRTSGALIVLLVAGLPLTLQAKSPFGAKASASAQDEAAAKMSVRQLSRQLETIRGLRFAKPVKHRLCTLHEAAAYMKQAVKDSAQPEIAESRDSFFRLLKLLPANAKSDEAISLLYSEQVRGLYDTKDKQLLVVTDVSSVGAEGMVGRLLATFGIDLTDVFMIHELDHALQDQNFNLEKLEAQASGRLDRELAMLSLVEGDATLVMFSYISNNLGMDVSTVMNYVGGNSTNLVNQALKQYPELQKAPPILRDLLTMPYIQGMQFVNTIIEQNGWPFVDKAFTRLPESTEHVLHPIKYLKNVDHPLQISFEALPDTFDNFQALPDDTAGEYVIRIWGQQFLGEVPGINAGRGWAGDTWRIYQGDNLQTFGVWATAWDSEGDVNEFANLVGKCLGQRGLIIREGTHCTVLMGVPNNLLPDLKEAVKKITYKS